MKKILLLISIFIFSYGAVMAQTYVSDSTNSITYNSAVIYGTIDTSGGNSSFEVYFVYEVKSGPKWGGETYEGPISISGSGSNSYSFSLTGLASNKQHRFKIDLYDITNDVENFGSWVNFTTNSAPTVTTDSVETSLTTQTSAKLYGAGDANDGTFTTSFGYKKHSDVTYTYVGATPSSISGTASTSFSKSITGLDAGTQYDFVAALFEGTTKIVEGSAGTFTTNAATAPVVTTGTIENVTNNSADVNTNTVNDDGGAELTSYGIYYGTSSPLGTQKEVGNTGFSSYPANFSTALTGGDPATEYYIQAYATNSVGTTKGAERKVYTEPSTRSIFENTFSGLEVGVGKLTLDFSTDGDGTGIIIIGRLTTDAAFTDPSDGTDPGAGDTDWANAPAIGGTGKLLYHGSVQSVSITGLDVTKDYIFYVFDYAGSGNSTATDYGINFAHGTNDQISTVDNEFPIDLLSFTAENADNAVVINWATASEFDNDLFEIERSTDAENFEVIASVPGAGYSNELINYSIKDADLLEGTVYYRLKQTDYNGAFTYSYILPVTIGGTNDIQISNVISKETSISFVYNNNNGGKTQMQLLDASGRIIKSQEVNGDGSQLIRMSMRGRSHGIYILHITLEDQTITKKVVF